MKLSSLTVEVANKFFVMTVALVMIRLFIVISGLAFLIPVSSDAQTFLFFLFFAALLCLFVDTEEPGIVPIIRFIRKIV